MTISEDLRKHRHELVVKHIEAENAQDAETALHTFTHPKYDLRAVEGGVIEGSAQVHEFIRGFRASLPSITYVGTSIHHADNAVIVEYRIVGRHDGDYAGIPPTGAEVDFPAIAVYEFDGPDLVCERMYLNLRGLEAQMRGGRTGD
ncbi:nuclear transport factor 2 family protein [Streptomyces sp. NPDC005803]|uniref:ester cyclase n=1 Tax=Streptomyces sp. NPDC005803 TaxID=3154297 RepID=UPI0033E57EB1